MLSTFQVLTHTLRYIFSLCRFRFSASRSRLDRFPISSSAESVIIPPRKAYARNASARNANAVSLVPDQEVSNAEFQNANSAFGSDMTNKEQSASSSSY
ncbi:hypothetical protein MTR67_006844 [Solanum verrucosum]|uniref:Uncharacterized protein n=1 Tax=Solanum verrucosum TaxID=315347 RepID=A0AAF0Q4W2_SOLVR|nr:hypothetical protein MTR67_006844 [Solanum verrucosum]